MRKRFSEWLLTKHLGWTIRVDQPHPDKFIICLAPHTSNWDFAIGQLYCSASGMKIGFLMKREWFFWPLGILFRRLGGIPVDRRRHGSMTDALAQAARDEKQFRLCITPEGTRSRVEQWKRGFYYVALKAQIPILLYGLDYERRLIECTKTIVPTGDVEADMLQIKLYFKNFKGHRPENFSVGSLDNELQEGQQKYNTK
ncbi:MAG: 1-acyl-sn-glycerol-3-phosphate acyltransferase [Prevotella sp.]|nr:1-acyl-sn-glycerol-3-phosphate acyltransferase [Prevotella sp.]